MPTILFLGATGYIGAAVFNAFINAHPAFDYSALVRSPSHLSHIRAVNTVAGALENRKLLTDLARKADIVVNVARADDLGMVEALIEGVKKRREEEGKLSALIHTCGGNTFEGREFWDDTDEDCVKAILNKPVEQAILRADEQGILQAYFIAPTIVYGLNPYEKPSPFYLQIICELLSLPPLASPIPFPPLTTSAVKESPHRQMGMVHVDDLASLYLLVLDKILRVHAGSTPISEEGASSRVYIASVFDRSRSLLYHDVHRALVKRGLFEVCSTVPDGEDTSPDRTHFLARRARTELGWEPIKPAWQHDMEWDINRAVEVLKVAKRGPPATKVA